jgi:hypothetical protein
MAPKSPAPTDAERLQARIAELERERDILTDSQRNLCAALSEKDALLRAEVQSFAEMRSRLERELAAAREECWGLRANLTGMTRGARKASPETMARLCEAVDRYFGQAIHSDVADELRAYRAETTPPLRSRDEVALEFMTKIGCSAHDGGPGKRDALTFNVPNGVTVPELLTLLLEFDRAPEPAPAAEKPFLTCVDCGLTRDQEPTVAVRWDERPRCNDCAAAWYRSNPGFANPLTDHDQDTREERPCGCEEAEALKDQVTELRRLLGHVYGTVAGLAKLLETLP